MATINRRFYLKNEELATKSYADSSFTAARTYADTKKQEAINASNNYTDTAISNNNANYLAKNNNTYYEPSSAYNPATKQYVDEAVAAAGGAEVVSELPEIGDEGKIYVVKEGDVYHQYIYNITDGWEEIGAGNGVEAIQMPISLLSLEPGMTTEQIIAALGGQDNVDKILDALENGKPIFGTALNPVTGEYIQIPMNISTSNINDGEQIHLSAFVDGNDWEMDLTHYDNETWEVNDVYITPMASQAYVTGAVNTAIGSLDITTRAVVAELPTQDISTKTIYMVPNSTPGSQNIYDEYIWLGDRWEMIGDTHIDLSTKQDVIQYETMPTADSSNVGDVIQYIGDTTGGYEQGHFYICVEEAGSGIPVYSWQEVNVQDATDLSNYLAKDNSISYTPSGNYNPATKKYVDDATANMVTTNGQQNISGLKIFNSYTPQCPNVPLYNDQLTNKKYVDDAVAASGGCQRDTVPTATSATVGDIIQYTGPTNEYYTNGYFYICVAQAGSGVPVYTWEQIDVQDQPDLSNYVTATVLNNMELNNIRMNFPCYYIDAISFDTVEPYITPSFEDVQAVVIAKMQQAYNDGKTKFYLIYRNANSTHPLRYFPVLIDINTNTGVITTTGYKQVCSVNSTEAVSFTVSMDYGTWSLVGGAITHTGEHIGGYIVNKSTFNYLAKNNITAYTPTLDYHPATKRYVDETVTNGIDNGYGVPAVEIMPAANSANFGKVVIYSGCEENVYWMPGHMYQCQQWEDEQHNVSYHWVEMAKRDAYDFFMPEATEENYDLIIQYKGQDTNDYKKGYFYRCAAYTDQGTVLYRWEPIAVDNYLKKDNTMSYTPTADYNPTTKKYVDDLIKPVVIWESNDPSTYLTAISANISASPAWQLTNLDMTPFKRIKIYTCAGQGTGTTASASTTAAMVLEMSLDPRAAISAYGGNYVGSTISQKPNDSNRLATLTCAVSADKTSFVVLRQTNLYGTAATSNNDVNANVFLIEGYYN